jgi:endonuclease/exonuclease/phosphatase family metal-dependent hydrolase
VLATIGSLAAALLSACEPLANDEDFEREPVLVFRRSTLVPAPDPGASPKLRVVAWNVKYGAGRIPFWFDCWGDRVEMSKAEVQGNMAGIYGLVNEVKPDILMAEEIELNSRRSAYYDMIRGVLEHTDMNYAAYFETWNSAYIASEGVGRINLGNAIFSRYPIVLAERIRQPDRTDQSALTAKFYIHRAVGRVEIEVRAGIKVAALVVHTEAYDNDGTKQKQIQQIHDLLKAEKLPFLVGGDFNELPPTAVRKVKFPDERATAVCSAEFTQPPYTPEVMQKFYDDFQGHIDLARYGTDETAQARYFTHTTLGPDDTNEEGKHGDWNRTLDFLFIRKQDAWVPGSTDVIQHKGQKLGGDAGLGPVIAADVLRLSDHAPVTGIWEVKP